VLSRSKNRRPAVGIERLVLKKEKKKERKKASSSSSSDSGHISNNICRTLWTTKLFGRRERRSGLIKEKDIRLEIECLTVGLMEPLKRRQNGDVESRKSS
jgi:hypothetical protein